MLGVSTDCFLLPECVRSYVVFSQRLACKIVHTFPTEINKVKFTNHDHDEQNVRNCQLEIYITISNGLQFSCGSRVERRNG